MTDSIFYMNPGQINYCIHEFLEGNVFQMANITFSVDYDCCEHIVCHNVFCHNVFIFIFIHII